MEIRQEMARQTSEDLDRKRNCIIKAAMTHKMGVDGWSVLDIITRGTKQQVGKTEVFAFDGEDLVQFYPIEIEKTGENTMKIIQRYELLHKRKQQNENS